MSWRRPITALACLMVLISACSSNTNSPSDSQNQAKESPSVLAENADPLGRYEQPVSFSIAKSADTKDLALPNGDTIANNEYYRYIEKKLNIKVTQDWQVETTEAYDQKLGVSIASGVLPDAFIVNEQQLKQLVAADLIEDLTDVYKNYANDAIKKIYDSYDNRVLGRATFNGKLMGLPNAQFGQQFNIVWIRQDWMDKFGLKAPQSLDDLVNIAKTFVDKNASGNGTVGITGAQQLAGYSMMHGFDPLFGAMNAYKGQWNKDASGNIAYSSISPNMKTALSKLHDLYAQGILDKEFALRKDPNELVANNKLGIIFGAWWAPYWPLQDSVKNDPKAEWKPFLAPLDANGKFNTPDQDPTSNFLVVRKGYKNPEAVVKVYNLQFDGISKTDPNSKDIYKDVPGIGGQWWLWPFTLNIGPDTLINDSYTHIKAAVDTKNPSSLIESEKIWYDNILKNQENPKKDLNAWAEATARMDGMSLMSSNKINYVRNIFFGKTKTMEQKWAILQKLEDETFLKIIMGEAPVDSFDSFVKQWNDLGGKQIIEEIKQEQKK